MSPYRYYTTTWNLLLIVHTFGLWWFSFIVCIKMYVSGLVDTAFFSFVIHQNCCDSIFTDSVNFWVRPFSYDDIILFLLSFLETYTCVFLLDSKKKTVSQFFAQDWLNFFKLKAWFGFPFFWRHVGLFVVCDKINV